MQAFDAKNLNLIEIFPAYPVKFGQIRTKSGKYTPP